MSCSPKYEKLVEYIKTHYTYQLKLNSFAVGNNEELDSKVRREVYGNIMDFVENLESQEEIKQKQKDNLVALDFTMPEVLNIDMPEDTIVLGTGGTSYSTVLGTGMDDDLFASMDGVNIPLAAGPVNVLGGMGEDHISFTTGISTDSVYTVSDYYEDNFGLVAGDIPEIKLSTEKDDK
tara:strand:- start:6219 stop:6752 length:534 start_codon:yes stop_codon:yes gene_type:complete